MKDFEHLEKVFDYYRSRHCKVALDDMGAGYSSLNMLVRLQPDIVKLDKELVQSLPGATGRAVVAAIVDITHSHGGLVLAECVETAEQTDAASDLRVDLRRVGIRTPGAAQRHGRLRHPNTSPGPRCHRHPLSP